MPITDNITNRPLGRQGFTNDDAVIKKPVKYSTAKGKLVAKGALDRLLSRVKASVTGKSQEAVVKDSVRAALQKYAVKTHGKLAGKLASRQVGDMAKGGESFQEMQKAVDRRAQEFGSLIGGGIDNPTYSGDVHHTYEEIPADWDRPRTAGSDSEESIYDEIPDHAVQDEHIYEEVPELGGSDSDSVYHSARSDTSRTSSVSDESDTSRTSSVSDESDLMENEVHSGDEDDDSVYRSTRSDTSRTSSVSDESDTSRTSSVSDESDLMENEVYSGDDDSVYHSSRSDTSRTSSVSDESDLMENALYSKSEEEASLDEVRPDVAKPPVDAKDADRSIYELEQPVVSSTGAEVRRSVGKESGEKTAGDVRSGDNAKTSVEETDE